MKHTWQAFVSVNVCLVLGGCVASTGEEVGEHQIGSVDQSLLLPQFARVSSSTNPGFNTAECPDHMPWALGAGAVGHLNLVAYGGGLVPTEVDVESTSSVNTRAQAMCSNAFGVGISATDTDGTVTAQCPSGKVAVGGGAMCSSSTARLRRSRPNPDTAGAKPTGWAATCNSGTVTAYALCVDEQMNFDFSSCRVKRAETTVSTTANVFCDGGDIPVGIGGYCRNSGKLTQLWHNASNVHASCDQVGVIATAVCCDGSWAPPP